MWPYLHSSHRADLVVAREHVHVLTELGVVVVDVQHVHRDRKHVLLRVTIATFNIARLTCIRKFTVRNT